MASWLMHSFPDRAVRVGGLGSVFGKTLPFSTMVYMLFAGWVVRIVVIVFTIRTDPKPVKILFIFLLSLKQKKLTEKNSRKRYCDRGQR